ncbi:MAG: alpha-L-fucosidase [Candidatus Sumerlaeota bacterium]|nr:alpha-L-fucosidase [Candidatus Sumerlaeota bacterium]
MKTTIRKTLRPLLCACIAAIAARGVAAEAQTEKDQRLAWWREARFGMMIHWGLYAVPAGEWKGQEIKGIGEWIMLRAKIPVVEYEQLAKQFNPVKFNADEWVQVAKDAGQKYIVITSKHHDGFAMFDSKASNYNIVKATPFGRDPMKELAAACQKQGIKLCFYYSHARDWHEPDASDNTWDWPDKSKKDFARYFESKAIPQVRELLTQYGPIGLIWFDTPIEINEQQSKEIADLVHELQPMCLVSGRVGHGCGDYESQGDNQIPGAVVPVDWETPATLNDTWGYKKNDTNWKPVELLVFKLVDIVGKGGNYLLNVGPTAEGVIPPPSVERLRAVGQWMKVNGESIYGCGATPFRRAPFHCTSKPGKLYVHLFEWPQSGRFESPAIGCKITKAYLLADPERKPLKVEQEGDKIAVALPAAAPDKIDSVLALEIEGKPEMAAQPIAQATDGSVTLPAADAAIHGTKAKYEADRQCVGFWTAPKDWVSWEFNVTTPGEFQVEISQASPQESAGSEYEIQIAGQTLKGTVKETKDYTKFRTVKLGAVKINEAGRCTLSVSQTRPATGGGGEVAPGDVRLLGAPSSTSAPIMRPLRPNARGALPGRHPVSPAPAAPEPEPARKLLVRPPARHLHRDADQRQAGGRTRKRRMNR